MDLEADGSITGLNNTTGSECRFRIVAEWFIYTVHVHGRVRHTAAGHQMSTKTR